MHVRTGDRAYLYLLLYVISRLLIKCGFEPVSWTKFDEEYAPPDWRKGVDEPENIIFFKYTGNKYIGRGTPEDKTYLDNEMKEFYKNNKPLDYDEAYELRDRSIKGGK